MCLTAWRNTYQVHLGWYQIMSFNSGGPLVILYILNFQVAKTCLFHYWQVRQRHIHTIKTTAKTPLLFSLPGNTEMVWLSLPGHCPPCLVYIRRYLMSNHTHKWFCWRFCTCEHLSTDLTGHISAWILNFSLILGGFFFMFSNVQRSPLTLPACPNQAEIEYSLWWIFPTCLRGRLSILPHCWEDRCPLGESSWKAFIITSCFNSLWKIDM